jgi:hypothetical protein
MRLNNFRKSIFHVNYSFSAFIPPSLALESGGVAWPIVYEGADRQWVAFERHWERAHKNLFRDWLDLLGLLTWGKGGRYIIEL